jgi:hypothetical protein
VSSPASPPPSAARQEVARRSAPALRWLSARPKLLLPLLSVLLLVGGLALPPGIGIPLLVVLLLIVGWLSYLSWPVVEGTARAIRLALLGLLVFAIVSRVL